MDFVRFTSLRSSFHSIKNFYLNFISGHMQFRYYVQKKKLDFIVI